MDNFAAVGGMPWVKNMTAMASTDINFVALVAQSYSVMGMKFSKILIIIALLPGVCLVAIWYANKSSLEGHCTVTYYGGAEGVSGSLAILKTRDGEFMIDCDSVSEQLPVSIMSPETCNGEDWI